LVGKKTEKAVHSPNRDFEDILGLDKRVVQKKKGVGKKCPVPTQGKQAVGRRRGRKEKHYRGGWVYKT